jgi:Tol biopolymer transport system component
MSATRAMAVVALVLASVPVARAAAPGDTVLVSRPAGLSPLAPGLQDWNVSGLVEAQGGEASNSITPDGHYAVFATQADGLAGGEDPALVHVIRKDLVSGAVMVVDAGANGSSTSPTISENGRFVAFASLASTLAAADTSNDADVFVKDLQTGAVTLITPGGAAAADPDCLHCLTPVLSSNGAEVAFVTRTSLVAGDTGTGSDVYAGPASGGGSYVLVSATPTGASGNAGSRAPSITDDGATVAFLSGANDIDFGDDPTNDSDLYVRILANAASHVASAQNGSDFGSAAGGVFSGQISGDGLKVVFDDTASYLPADVGTTRDVYERTLATKADVLISVATDGTQGDQGSFGPVTDATGAHVAFASSATNLGGSAPGFDLFVRDVAGSQTTALTDGADGITFPAIAHGTGNDVVFAATGGLPDAPTSPGSIHVSPVGGGAPTVVSAPASGQPLVPGLTATREPDFYRGGHRVSQDGRFVVFVGDAPALGGPAGARECWRRDLRTGALDLVSVTATGPVATCDRVTISSDGTKVAFVTYDPLDPADSGTGGDVYVHDMATGANTLASRADGASGAALNGDISDAELSGDGAHVAFGSNTTSLGVPGGKRHVYVRDLGAARTEVADVSSTGVVGTLDAGDFSVGLSADGRRVAFDTNSQLVPADPDTLPDVYVRDLAAATTTLASVQSTSAGGAKGNLGSLAPSISADGRRVTFNSAAQNLEPALAPWPAGQSQEIFLRDLGAQTTTMVSRSASGTAAGDVSTSDATLDATGGVVAMSVYPNGGPNNLAPEVTDDTGFVLVRTIATGEVRVVRVPALGAAADFTPSAGAPSVSPDGHCLSFYARGRGIVPGLSPDFQELFARVLEGDCGTVAAGGGGGDGGGPGPGQGGTAAPVLSKVSLSARRFRVGKKATAVTARRKKAPVGTKFRFTLSASATLTIRLDRLTKGRRVGKRCFKATRRLRKRKACDRATAKGTLTRKDLGAGAHSVAFTGRVGKHALSPGRYRATLTAGAAAGSSKPVRLAFTVVR